jgi:hypothetical protein
MFSHAMLSSEGLVETNSDMVMIGSAGTRQESSPERLSGSDSAKPNLTPIGQFAARTLTHVKSHIAATAS